MFVTALRKHKVLINEIIESQLATCLLLQPNHAVLIVARLVFHHVSLRCGLALAAHWIEATTIGSVWILIFTIRRTFANVLLLLHQHSVRIDVVQVKIEL